MNKQQALRTLAVKLNVSGTAEILDEPYLYAGSYGFIKIQVYAPKTQNTDAPVCTAFCTTRDELGREKISTNNYNLLYVGESELDGLMYLRFECFMPKEFTALATAPKGLQITFNYYDTEQTLDGEGNPLYDGNGLPQRHTTDLLVSSRIITTVYPGGWNNAGVELNITSAEAAQIGRNTRAIQQLQNNTMRRVLADVTFNAEQGTYTKLYSDGSTVTQEYPTGGGSSELVADNIRIITFDEMSFTYTNLSDASKGYELVLSPTVTGYANNEYIASLESSDSERGGFVVLSETYFKGSDGSLLLFGIDKPFAGRLLLYGAGAGIGKNAKGITIDRATNSIHITYFDNTEADISVPTKVSQLENDADYQSGADVKATIAELVDGAPETLDTLKELAAALGGDAEFAANVGQSINRLNENVTELQDAVSHLDGLVIDDTISATSENAVQNKAVAKAMADLPPKAFDISIATSRWKSKSATLTASDNALIERITANSCIEFVASDTSAATVITCDIKATTVSAGSITVTCATVPTAAVKVTIIILSF